MSKVKCVVAGAGSVGLAIARRLSQRYETLILEACGKFGTKTSSRNSEVLHRGIYYKKNSLKAIFCVESVPIMYDYLCSRKIPYRKCGKLIVATNPAEAQELQSLYHKAVANSVSDIFHLSAADVKVMEPNVQCVGALYSPSTGIFDSHTFMLNMLADAEQNGAMLVCNCDVLGVTAGANFSTTSDPSPRFVVATSQGDVGCDIFVNACGLRSVAVAASEEVAVHPLDRVPPAHFLKGNYYKYSGEHALVHPAT
jgi:L-2-hydroxyglutarate oxidase LhgO